MAHPDSQNNKGHDRGHGVKLKSQDSQNPHSPGNADQCRKQRQDNTANAAKCAVEQQSHDAQRKQKHGQKLHLVVVDPAQHDGPSGKVNRSILILLLLNKFFKLFEKVSPNKTIEGGIAGVIGSLLVLVLVKLLALFDFTWFHTILIGIVIGIIGQMGDLVESWFKRDAGVKDSSALLPGHGGMLDRFDSIIFVSPAMFLMLNLLLK